MKTPTFLLRERRSFHINGSWYRSGFTLVELLVAMAVLVVIILLVAQMTGSATDIVSVNGKHLDADSEARLVLGRMEVEFGKMLRRGDIDYASFKQPASTIYFPYGSNVANSTSNIGFSPNLQTGGNDRLAFYTETSGSYDVTNPPSSGSLKSAVSLVAYMIAPQPYNSANFVPVLWRLGKGLGWEPGLNYQNVGFLPMTISQADPSGNASVKWPALFALAGGVPPVAGSDSAEFRPLGYQVFRFEYTYLLKPNLVTGDAARLSVTPWDIKYTPAHTSINGFKDVAAIVVGIAMLDNTSREIVTTEAQYTKLTGSLLPDAVDGQDIASLWNPLVAAPTFAASAGIPQRAASSVRVYQRYFYLGQPASN